MRKHLRLVAASVACLAVSGSLAAASSASAAPVWNPGGETYWTGNVTFELNGGSPVVCETANNNGTISSWISKSAGFATLFPYGIRALCPKSQEFNFSGAGAAEGSSGAYAVSIKNASVTYPTQQSPFGVYTEAAGATIVSSFVNGSGVTSSTATFTKQKVGTRNSDGLPITISGTLKVTTPSGGLMTLK
ncbi:MAG TPA: hypothetical protein VFJ57_00155 [Solirubrobacterales bacterium]|nr:hypothetical protein [Solirubrobacterales bacterium]